MANSTVFCHEVGEGKARHGGQLGVKLVSQGYLLETGPRDPRQSRALLTGFVFDSGPLARASWAG